MSSLDDGLDFEVMDELNNEAEKMESDYMWMKELGWLDNPSDAPEVFQEDLAMFQGSKANRKAVQFIVKCLKNAVCKKRAEQTYKGWGKNYKQFMEGNMDSYMKPITTSLTPDPENPNGMGA